MRALDIVSTIFEVMNKVESSKAFTHVAMHPQTLREVKRVMSPDYIEYAVDEPECEEYDPLSGEWVKSKPVERVRAAGVFLVSELGIEPGMCKFYRVEPIRVVDVEERREDNGRR